VREDRLIDVLRQHPEIFTPGAYSTIFGSASQPAEPSQPQPSLQQPAPAQKTNDKASDKGNNGKH
jgi:hypothetical protein